MAGSPKRIRDAHVITSDRFTAELSDWPAECRVTCVLPGWQDISNR